MSEETVAEPSALDGQTAATPTAMSEAAELAWSAVDDVKDDTEDADGLWRNRLRWAAAVTLVFATTAATVWLAMELYREKSNSSGAREPAAAPAVTPVAPPRKPLPSAAPTSAIPLPPIPPAEHERVSQPTAQPEPSPPPQPGPDADIRYLAMVSEIFEGAAIPDPSLVISDARTMCDQLQNGSTPAAEEGATMNRNPSVTAAQAAAVINSAISVYCPHYAG